MEPIIRLFITVGLFILGFGLYRVVNTYLLSRVKPSQVTLPGFLPGKPAILYFTTPDCVTCKIAQKPAIQSLQNRLGDSIQVVEIDLYEHPEYAKQWQVLSVPTTYVLNSKCKPCHVNHGLTRTETLVEQIRQAELQVS